MRFVTQFITFSLLLAGSTLAQPHDTDTDTTSPARHFEAGNRLAKVRLTSTPSCAELDRGGQAHTHPACVVDASRGSVALDTPLRQVASPPVTMASLDKRGKVKDFFMGNELERANREAQWAHESAAKANHKTALKQLKLGGKKLLKNNGSALDSSKNHIEETQNHREKANEFRMLGKTTDYKSMSAKEREDAIAYAKQSAREAELSKSNAKRNRP